MAEQESVSVEITMSKRGYQALQLNRGQEGYQEMSFDEYVERMALLGSFVSKIQQQQEGVVLFESFEGERTLIDDKILEELRSLPKNIEFFPPHQS